MVSHLPYLNLPYLKVVLISSHLTSPLSTTYNHLPTVCRRYKLPYRPGPHHLNHTPRFRFRFRFGEPPRPDSTSSYTYTTILLIQRPFCVYVPKTKSM